ncbi:hypothetical protein KBI33_01820 [Candidatus Shapirobacteria bacterium]|nr:hypothetical protein [Candidatus Shapirobacteria bacterium]
MAKQKGNEISAGYFGNPGLKKREREILEDISARSGFIPKNLMGESSWWGSSEIGAFHYTGIFEGKKAVLKVQGVRPNISEIYMIESFARENKSKIIRPPYLYCAFPWDEEKKYEVLILEFIDGPKVIQTPAAEEQIKRFFELYQDYRYHCLRSPWVGKPGGTLSAFIGRRFRRWREASFKIYPRHPLRQEGDAGLIDAAIKKLKTGYKGVEMEFVHGHFSENDLYQAGDQVVILSNLYWSWRQPFCDAVFGYHWFIYHLGSVEGITPTEIERQRKMWLSAIGTLPQAQTKEGKKLLNLALLERAAAGLNLDSLTLDPKKPISAYLVEATRDQLKELLEKD